MELDEIKKMWNEIDTLKEKQQVNENRIKEMLKNKGKSALEKLMKVAKFYTIAIIPLGVLMCLLSYRFFQAGGYYIIVPLVFLLLCMLLEPCQIYLYRLLKGINYSSMTVKEVSERILKYQNIVQKSRMYGMIIFVIYLGTWYYLYYKLYFGSEVVWEIIILMIVMIVAGSIAIPIAYKKLYFNNINRIKENLEELKEFENNNN